MIRRNPKELAQVVVMSDWHMTDNCIVTFDFKGYICHCQSRVLLYSTYLFDCRGEIQFWVREHVTACLSLCLVLPHFGVNHYCENLYYHPDKEVDFVKLCKHILIVGQVIGLLQYVKAILNEGVVRTFEEI